MNNRRRVVITGMGAVSPLGCGVKTFYHELRRGTCSIRQMTEWNTGAFHDHTFLGSPAELPPDFAKSIPRTVRRSMGKIALFSACAAKEAADQAGLDDAMLSSGRIGCVIGSTMGSGNAIAESFRILNLGKGLEEMPSMQFFKSMSHTATMNVAHYLKIAGTVMAPCAACASALQSIGIARDMIASGSQDVILCGGAEELTPEACGSFDLIFASCDQQRLPQEASRPFDADRTGLVCGDGAGIIALEELEHARKRGAAIYGELIGFATTCCGAQISQSDSASIIRCMENTLQDAGLTPETVDYVNAHATSTEQGDRAEAEAIAAVFGNSVPVSSLKGNMGHTLGASGALELIASLQMMDQAEILPTMNFHAPGPGCEGICHVPERMEKDLNVILKNSFAFGGINAAVLCRKYIE